MLTPPDIFSNQNSSGNGVPANYLSLVPFKTQNIITCSLLCNPGIMITSSSIYYTSSVATTTDPLIPVRNLKRFLWTIPAQRGDIQTLQKIHWNENPWGEASELRPVRDETSSARCERCLAPVPPVGGVVCSCVKIFSKSAVMRLRGGQPGNAGLGREKRSL